ncbi:SIP domain-containing protein [Olleya sp. UBA1516]|uniref:siderophore-interacting protein n=1 Tax=Olleya sp. UBA1516 TaxID=1947013 RepID=UPI002600A828|nr:SIP domain-containing protein [Olleya sp. UBA1516]|tara:strand:- start:889 stop:1611 length:723 start_codon:yes stop_codon:yes gene_type:complete
MALLETIMKKIMDKGQITSKTRLTDSVYKIDITSDAIKTMDFMAGYFIRLGIGIGTNTNSKKDMVRSYSIWDINKDTNTISLAIATDSNGIGAQWVKNCNVGDTVYYKTKKGTFTLNTSADSYLMIGDLSALSHLYIINRSLENKPVESIIYNNTLSDLFEDVDGTKPFNFYKLEENAIDSILEKVKEQLPNLKEKKMVYIAGDSRVCVALNHYFRKELHWDSKQIKTKPFWNPEKTGLE